MSLYLLNKEAEARKAADADISAQAKKAEAVATQASAPISSDAPPAVDPVEFQLLKLAVSGAMQLALDSASTNVSAAALNAAAAGAFRSTFTCRLRAPVSLDTHTWCSAVPVLTEGGTFADVDIADPTVIGSDATFSKGLLKVTIEWDTDAGATKTYQVGDSATVQVDLSGIAFFADVAPVTKTFAVIA